RPELGLGLRGRDEPHVRSKEGAEACGDDEISAVTFAHRVTPSIGHSTGEVWGVDDREQGIFEGVPVVGRLGTNGVVVAFALLPLIATIGIVGQISNETRARLIADTEVVAQRLHSVERYGAADDIGKLPGGIDR